MMRPWAPARRALAALSLLTLTLLFAGCDLLSSPQNTMSPEGDVSDLQARLLWLVIWIALAVLIVVFAGLGYVLLRFRRKTDDEAAPKQIHGNTRLEVAWTIVPTVILMALAVPIIGGIIELADTPDDAMHITVTATQWNWAFEYTDPEFQTAGEPLKVDTNLHVPVDRDIAVDLVGRDVIHSFWVPKLAGKTDVIPGRTNKMWFNAEEAGTFGGQCAEFCGSPPNGGGHAVMKFTVVAQTQDEFDAWVREQMSGAQASSSSSGGDGLTDEQLSTFARFRLAAPEVDEATVINIARNPAGAAAYMQAAGKLRFAEAPTID